jgi:M3 family oligoendopeptidase
MSQAANETDCLQVVLGKQVLTHDLTAVELCHVRHDLNVNDPFYEAEQQYYDEIEPKLKELSNQLDRLMVESPFRPYLETVLGQQALIMMEEGLRGFEEQLIPLLQEENEWTSRHNRLVSNGVVMWQGQAIKRDLMAPMLQSPDRQVRQQAALAVAESWQQQRQELEQIYQHLVENRHRQAEALGFQNYVELSYHRMCRIGYGPKEAARFRQAVKTYLVPLLLELEERRRQRLGLDELHFYDRGIKFFNGNPTPMGDTADSLNATREMYHRLSPETGEFIDFMLDNGLCDVEIRDGKRGGGYMTYFTAYQAPFILANFDGTSENAYIMCHEGGHAFQGYLQRQEPIRERCQCTSETAETHAMAMEFFAWPYMELFFGERAEDYRTMHLEDALFLIARECLQDDFQQQIYEQPQRTAEERNRLWKTLEAQYCPYLDFTGCPGLEEGCDWQRIPHLFQWPFYAIDYALAQVCALHYLRWMETDRPAAWQSYLGFCRKTGTMTFPELAAEAGLGDPFGQRELQELTAWLRGRLGL